MDIVSKGQLAIGRMPCVILLQNLRYPDCLASPHGCTRCTSGGMKHCKKPDAWQLAVGTAIARSFQQLSHEIRLAQGIPFTHLCLRVYCCSFASAGNVSPMCIASMHAKGLPNPEHTQLLVMPSKSSSTAWIFSRGAHIDRCGLLSGVTLFSDSPRLMLVCQSPGNKC